jgi:agmatine/peptidylarginine deiminase
LQNNTCTRIICLFIITVIFISSSTQVIGADFEDEIRNTSINEVLDQDSYTTDYNEIISHAEFEQTSELIITWPTMYRLNIREESYFVDIVRSAEKAVSVRINVNNFLYKNRVISTLNEENIPLDNITISITPTNSIWIRDYGPFFIEKNGELSIIDFNYIGHRSRLIDDIFPTIYGIQNDIEFDFKANFALCIQGGNYMSDGHGRAILANYSLEIGNPNKTLEEMSEILKQYLGLDDVIILPSQADDGTGHVDMFSKLINKDTLLVGQWGDTNDINYQILENNTQFLIDQGYNIIRIPMIRDPDEDKNTIWTYTNSLIINGTNKKIVLVPIYGADEDETALSIYEQTMPDYEIIGIYSNLVIDYLGAVHCTTITRPMIT